jgi:LCP family protein required for cell wall assembly
MKHAATAPPKLSRRERRQLKRDKQDVPPRPPKARRTWAQRGVLALNLSLIAASLLTAAAVGWGYSKVHTVARRPVTALDPVLTADADGSRPAENYLIIGTDSAEGLDPDDPILEGRPPGLRSDTLMVLRVDPDHQQAVLLSLPRDLWVPIAGSRGNQRINTAIEGGPDRLIETIQEYLEIPINHYVEINFAGFKSLIGSIGGVPMYFPEPARDRRSGLAVLEAGCVTLDSSQALAFARSRAYEVRRNGRWRTDPTGDLGRISRQQLFIRKVLSRAIERGARNPVVLRELVDTGFGAVTLDPELTLNQLKDLGLRLRSFDPSTLETLALPVTDDVVEGASVLRLQQTAAQPILDRFRPKDTEAMSPDDVLLFIENGTGAAGQASAVARDFRDAGFNVPSGASGDADRFDYQQSVVRYVPGSGAAADLVARSLVNGAELQEVPLLPESDVHLVVGADYAGVLDEPRPPDPSSTTTSTTTPFGTSSTSSSSTTSTTVVGEVPETPEDVSC